MGLIDERVVTTFQLNAISISQVHLLSDVIRTPGSAITSGAGGFGIKIRKLFTL